MPSLPIAQSRSQADIVLTTINARYIHASAGLRYLLANMGELQPRTVLVEFEIKQRALEIASELMAYSPRIIGFGVYIWNATLTGEVLDILKRVRPEITIVLGGPEVSYETESQPLAQLADCIITGEADLKFAEVCRALLKEPWRGPKIIPAELPPLAQVQLPYAHYSDADLRHRVLYVEASRGCPFSCEFCLSSLDIPVRGIETGRLLGELQALIQRGALVFKFVDRTFNLNLSTVRTILDFFLLHWREGMFLHFEMVPDRMPAALVEMLARFPAGGVQLEVGIQTFDEQTARNISRRQNYAKLEANLRLLREKTGVHIHADLIAGLPGETLESFARGFDRLLALGPQEIQVGILKRLRGTPIVRHDQEWEMVYAAHPPYEILRNKLMDFETLQRIRRFARFWDLLANSGRFPESLPLLWENEPSPFFAFLAFSDWLGQQLGRNHSIALASLAEHLFAYLQQEKQCANAAEILSRDWQRDGVRRENLSFLSQSPAPARAPAAPKAPSAAKRQARHTAQSDGPQSAAPG